MPPTWFVRVATDAELMDAWLSRAIPDDEIIDADVLNVRRTSKKSFSSLSDLTRPPALLVIKLGVKAARNSAMSEVLLETINTRAHEDLPTWIVDSPGRRLTPGHLSYDELVKEALADWERIELSDPEGKPVRMIPRFQGFTTLTISDATGSEVNGDTKNCLTSSMGRKSDKPKKNRRPRE
jgi:hypothetical protein